MPCGPVGPVAPVVPDVLPVLPVVGSLFLWRFGATAKATTRRTTTTTKINATMTIRHLQSAIAFFFLTHTFFTKDIKNGQKELSEPDKRAGQVY